MTINTMKKILFFFALILSVAVFSQSKDQQKILADSKSFVEKFKEKNYDHILDLTYPALFEKLDREQLKSAFAAMFENNDAFTMDIVVDKNDKFEVSDIRKTSDGISYAFVTYPSKFSMTFKEDLDEASKKMMTSALEQQGISVKFTDTKSLLASKPGMMLALNDEKTKGEWKYLNHDENNPMYTSIVPKEIMQLAKDYYSKK